MKTGRGVKNEDMVLDTSFSHVVANLTDLLFTKSIGLIFPIHQGNSH